MKFILPALCLVCTFPSDASSWQAASIEHHLDNQSQQIQKSSVSKGESNLIQEQPARLIEGRPQHAVHTDFWIYDAQVTLLHDVDADGFYSRFSLIFDADSRYGSAAVYARLYLGHDDVFREYHSTSVFNLLSNSAEDAFRVDTRLIEGFVSDDYEILIALFDAQTHEEVAFYDGMQDTDLYLLPLESSEYEYMSPPVQVVVNQESGGSVGWPVLLGLALLLTLRKTVRRR